MSIKKRSVMLFVVVLLGSVVPSVAEDGKNSFSVYGGVTTEKDLQSLATLQYGEFINSNIGVLAFGRNLKTYKKTPLRWECEGQIAKHWGFQQHWEANALVILRWLEFPWDHHIDTSFAVGDGISYASEKPKIEVAKMGDTSKILNYLMFELECVIPKHPTMSLFARIHHRSGIYGLIDGVSGGSNMVTGGFRIRF
jgi:hypothetical protein